MTNPLIRFATSCEDCDNCGGTGIEKDAAGFAVNDCAVCEGDGVICRFDKPMEVEP